MDGWMKGKCVLTAGVTHVSLLKLFNKIKKSQQVKLKTVKSNWNFMRAQPMNTDTENVVITKWFKVSSSHSHTNELIFSLFETRFNLLDVIMINNFF